MSIVEIGLVFNAVFNKASIVTLPRCFVVLILTTVVRTVRVF